MISETELMKNACRTEIPTCPGQWSIAVGVTCLSPGSSVEEHLHGSFLTESRRTVQSRLSLCPRIPP